MMKVYHNYIPLTDLCLKNYVCLWNGAQGDAGRGSKEVNAIILSKRCCRPRPGKGKRRC